MNQSFKKFLLAKTASSDCFKTEVIQSLWSGYGDIKISIDRFKYRFGGGQEYRFNE